MWFLSLKKQKFNVQIHCIPYYIPYNPQKHPQFPLEESSMPKNKMEKEEWSLI